MVTVADTAHVRRADLPWRAATTTECGPPVSAFPVVLERQALFALIRDEGEEAAARAVCGTCLTMSRRCPDWDDNPVLVLHRQFWGGGADPGFADELRALAALVAAHRAEFDQLRADLGRTVRLADVRAQRADARRRHPGSGRVPS